MRDTLSPHRFGERLAEAKDFVAIGVVVCELVAELAADCVVALYDRHGRPTLLVDRANLTDGDRIAYLEARWRDDAVVRELREHSAPVDLPGGLLLPILASGYVLGSIRCTGMLGEPARRDLTTLASYVSVRAAELELASRGDPAIHALTRRQLDVALQMARGRTNAEVAAALGLSENTVKKHLKDVFLRLGVTNRTECAARLGHHAPPVLPPVGVSRIGSISVTRAGG